jgi:L-malate glycosyltransferase
MGNVGCLYFTGHHTEIHPISLLECLACGVPIVAEDKGGTSEIVEHGVSGVLCREWSEAVSVIKQLSRDHVWREQLSLGALHSAASFSLEEHSRAWKAVARF